MEHIPSLYNHGRMTLMLLVFMVGMAMCAASKAKIITHARIERMGISAARKRI